MNPSGSPQPDDSAARLQRLEEHSGFLEHTVEQLSREIAELNQRLSKMSKRLDQLEAGLAKDEAREEPG